MKMITYWKLLILLFSPLAVLPLTSCGDEDVPEIVEPEVPGNNNPESDNSAEIEAYVNASCTYRDYFWHVTITSTLESQYPDREVSYNLAFGSYGDATFYTIDNNDGKASSSIRTSNGTTYVEIVAPFYYHFIAMGLSDPDNAYEYYSKCAECEFWMNPFLEIHEDDYLSDDERELLDEIVSELNKYEREIKYDNASVIVTADVKGIGSATVGKHRL